MPAPEVRNRTGRALTCPLLLAVVTVSLAKIDDYIKVHSYTLWYIAAIVVVASFNGICVTIGATAASCLLLDFFFLEPRYALTLDLGCISLLLVGLTAGLIVTYWRRRYRRLARQSCRDVRATVNETFRAVGADSWSAVYATPDRRRFLLWPTGQRPEVTERQFTAGARKIAEHSDRDEGQSAFNPRGPAH